MLKVLEWLLGQFCHPLCSQKSNSISDLHDTVFENSKLVCVAAFASRRRVRGRLENPIDRGHLDLGSIGRLVMVAIVRLRLILRRGHRGGGRGPTTRSGKGTQGDACSPLRFMEHSITQLFIGHLSLIKKWVSIRMSITKRITITKAFISSSMESWPVTVINEAKRNVLSNLIWNDE